MFFERNRPVAMAPQRLQASSPLKNVPFPQEATGGWRWSQRRTRLQPKAPGYIVLLSRNAPAMVVQVTGVWCSVGS